VDSLLYVLIGILAGVSSGFFGIGGGVVMVPALALLAGFTQHQAQGTALAAMVPCVTFFAAFRYYQSGNVKLFAAICIAAGIFLGGYIGAVFANNIPAAILRKVFAVLLFFASIRLMLK